MQEVPELQLLATLALLVENTGVEGITDLAPQTLPRTSHIASASCITAKTPTMPEHHQC